MPPTEPAPPAEGRWTLTVSATDDQGLPSSATRRFWVNSTLGFLRIAPARLVLPPAGASGDDPLDAGPGRARPRHGRDARGSPDPHGRGATVRAGTPAVAWNGRLPSGKLAAGGRYVVRVTATNEVGTVDLSGPLTVRRTARPKR